MLLAAAAAIWLYGQQQRGGIDAPYVEIIYRGEVVQIINLYSSGLFSIEQLPYVEFEVRDSAVAFIRSNCPDQICVNTGWLRISGDFAACLPNRVLLVIPVADSSLDTITR